MPNVRMSIVRGHRGVTFDWVSDLRLSRHINAGISDISTLVTTFITCRTRKSIKLPLKMHPGPRANLNSNYTYFHGFIFHRENMKYAARTFAVILCIVLSL